jgi:hypothetical protein
MAKDKPKPAAPEPAAAGKPTPYPRTWGSMTQAQRQAWMKEHRPNRPQHVAVAPVKAPAPTAVGAPAPAPAPTSAAGVEGGQLVRIEVIGYRVAVGTRDPVECTGLELLRTVDAEMDAWEEQCQADGEGEDYDGE